jgi:hypothetical protein
MLQKRRVGGDDSGRLIAHVGGIFFGGCGDLSIRKLAEAYKKDQRHGYNTQNKGD